MILQDFCFDLHEAEVLFFQDFGKNGPQTKIILELN
jgi:hypothetical protein